MKQKVLIICLLKIMLMQNNIFAQSNGLLLKDIYPGPKIMVLETKIIKEDNIKQGITKYYLEFSNSNQYILKSELENILKDKDIIISFRDEYIFSEKNTILKYDLNDRGATLLMTFCEDESSRCEIFFNNIRQICFETKDLELLYEYFEESLDTINKFANG